MFYLPTDRENNRRGGQSKRGPRRSCCCGYVLSVGCLSESLYLPRTAGLGCFSPAIQHWALHIPRNICCSPGPSEPWGCFQGGHKRKMFLHYLHGPEKIAHYPQTSIQDDTSRTPPKGFLHPKGMKIPWQERKPSLYIAHGCILCSQEHRKALPMSSIATVAIFMIVCPPPPALMKNPSQPLPSLPHMQDSASASLYFLTNTALKDFSPCVQYLDFGISPPPGSCPHSAAARPWGLPCKR